MTTPNLVYMTQEDVVRYGWHGFWTGLVIGVAIGFGASESLKRFRL